MGDGASEAAVRWGAWREGRPLPYGARERIATGRGRREQGLACGLGHSAGLKAPRAFIQDRGAASLPLPYGVGMPHFLVGASIARPLDPRISSDRTGGEVLPAGSGFGGTKAPPYGCLKAPRAFIQDRGAASLPYKTCRSAYGRCADVTHVPWCRKAGGYGIRPYGGAADDRWSPLRGCS